MAEVNSPYPESSPSPKVKSLGTTMSAMTSLGKFKRPIIKEFQEFDGIMIKPVPIEKPENLVESVK